MGYIDGVHAVLASSIFGTTTSGAGRSHHGVIRRTVMVAVCAWPLLSAADFRFEPATGTQAFDKIPDSAPSTQVETLAEARRDRKPAVPNASQSGWRIGHNAKAASQRVARVNHVNQESHMTDLISTSKVDAPALFSQAELSEHITTRVKPETVAATSQSVPASAFNAPLGTPLPFSSSQSRSSSCANFEFTQGLLKANLIRALAQCGLTIGRWGIGDEEYEYDMEIAKGYSLRVSGIAALLDAIETTYLIRGTRNSLDQTIDFEPSRGAILEGMEIKEW